MGWNVFFIIATAGGLACGCRTVPANPLSEEMGGARVTNELMARKDRIIEIPSAQTYRPKPVLVLLHGATDDPTEMMAIAREWRGTYDVFIYAYNYHHRVQRVAADFDNELQKLRAENRPGRDVTIVDYSYSAIVFREAVIIADDPGLFQNVVGVIQLAPTAGGSYLARGTKNPVIAWVVSRFSHPTHAVDPYGAFAEQLWGGDSKQRFYARIPPGRLHTILLEGDRHSVARMADKHICEHYANGTGTNLVIIPESAGVIHDYLPANPLARAYLRTLLAWPQDSAARNQLSSVAGK